MAAASCSLSSFSTKLSSSSSAFFNQSKSRGRCAATSSQTPPVTPMAPPQEEKRTQLPIRQVPGGYGLPIFGPWKDRQDYFYNQGKDEFFNSRIKKYNSTVFKTNMPPGAFISSNPNVVALLDGKSFPALFDVDKVEKRDLFTGTYMPSTQLTGGYRVLSYLDPSEPNHEKVKNILFFMLSSRRDSIIPEFHNSYTEMFQALEKEIAAKGKADFSGANDQAAFNFLGKAYYGVSPKDTKLGSSGPTIIAAWVLFHLHPILTLGLPSLIENPLLHTIPLPPILIKSFYQRLYDYFKENSNPILDQAEILGLSRDEACHNLLFATCFNSFGGMKILFPDMIKWAGQSGADVQNKLAKEIRSAIASSGGRVTMSAMENMPLMKSVVYEALRINPPVPFQYGKAKRDFVVESHDGAYQIKKGEMLFGFQPFATNDPKIFDRPQEFVADRFVGQGEELLKHVLWSNGPETEDPSVSNKQCAGKNFVVLVSRLLLVELFRRYDSFEIEVGSASALGASVSLTALKPASF